LAAFGMEANKSDAEKCIRIAKEAAGSGDYEKAIKFLNKAHKLYPSEVITKLIDDYEEMKSNRNSFQSSPKVFFKLFIYLFKYTIKLKKKVKQICKF